MADNSKIQWTEATWNVVTGCTKVSDGCLNCYIPTTPPFRMAKRRFDSDGIGGSTGVILHRDRLDWPLKWRDPRMIFVNSLSDLFHEDVPDRVIAEVFNVMGAAKRHTFQLLTKRQGRMRALLRRWSEHATKGCYCPTEQGGCSAPVDVEHGVWPLPNVWVGVSAEDQRWADVRIPVLLDTPAAVRWVSAEPLLGGRHAVRGAAESGDRSSPARGCGRGGDPVRPTAARMTASIASLDPKEETDA